MSQKQIAPITITVELEHDQETNEPELLVCVTRFVPNIFDVNFFGVGKPLFPGEEQSQAGEIQESSFNNDDKYELKYDNEQLVAIEFSLTSRSWRTLEETVQKNMPSSDILEWIELAILNSLVKQKFTFTKELPKEVTTQDADLIIAGVQDIISELSTAANTILSKEIKPHERNKTWRKTVFPIQLAMLSRKPENTIAYA